MSQNIDYIISRIRDLPTLPDVVAEISRKTSDPKTNAREIGELISRDLSISSKVLKTVNSARYGFKRCISDIRGAIVVLGFDAVRDLSLSIAVFNSLEHKGRTGVFDRTLFWEHSLGVAVASEAIGRMVRYPNPSEIFLAGLLHDIGKVVLDIFTPDDFEVALDMAIEENVLLYEAEKRVFGFTHCEAGLALAKKWTLAENLREAIGYHHNPSPVMANIDYNMTAIVHLADILVRALEIGNGGDSRIPAVRGEVMGIYGELVDKRLKECLEAIDALMQKSMPVLSFAQNQ